MWLLATIKYSKTVKCILEDIFRKRKRNLILFYIFLSLPNHINSVKHFSSEIIVVCTIQHAKFLTIPLVQTRCECYGIKISKPLMERRVHLNEI
jgi:hypothetical protein